MVPRAVGRLARFFTGTPAPMPPAQLGPFGSEAEARQAARAADMRYAAWLDAHRGFMEPLEQEGGWMVLRRGQEKPSWMWVDGQ